MEQGSFDARGGTFASLRFHAYRQLWVGQICHDAALWMEMAARPFLVMSIAGADGAAHVAGVLAVRVAPHVILGPVAGVLGDFFDRRRILLIDQSATTLLNLVFTWLVLAGSLELWHLYAYSIVRGALMAFDQPARQSLIPALVPAEQLTNAVALVSTSQNTMRILGGILGGLIYALFGGAGSFIGISLVYLGALVSTYRLETPPNARIGPISLREIGAGLTEGMHYGVSQPAVRGVLLLMVVYNSFCMMFTQVFLPLLAEQVLSVGPLGFGGYSALFGVGALCAALTIARVRPTALGRLLPGFVVVSGGLMIALSLATFSPFPWRLALPAIAAMGLGAMQTSFFSLSRALLLASSPSRLHARVMSLLSFDRAFLSAGAAAGGILAGIVGVQFAVIGFGAAALSGGLAVRTFARSFRLATTVRPELSAAPQELAARESLLAPSASICRH